MSVIYKFLFPSKPDSTAMSLLLLALRILFGVLLMSHGVQKWANFDAMSESFPDPLGVGSQMSLIFGHFWRTGLFTGFYLRIPLPSCYDSYDFHNGHGIFFVIHGNDPFSVKELAFIYLVVFVLMYIAGPGKYFYRSLLSLKLYRKPTDKY